MQDYSPGETSVTVTRTVGDHVRILSVRGNAKIELLFPLAVNPTSGPWGISLPQATIKTFYRYQSLAGRGSFLPSCVCLIIGLRSVHEFLN